MEKNQSAKRQIIQKSFVRLMLVNMVVLIAINICGFVDNIVVGTRLNTNALAAMSCFSPVSAISGLGYIVILGTLIVCGNLIGLGKPDKVNALVSSSFWTVTVYCLVFSAALMIFREPLATLLGAKGEVHQMLCDYILGFAPGIVFMSLTAMLTALAPYNNAIGISYGATATLFFGNVLFDIVLVRPMGILGIGLASTLSSLASFMVLLPVYLKKRNTVRLVKTAFDGGLLLRAMSRGLPVLFFSFGMLIKNSLLNYTMIHYVGYDAVAVAGVLASVCGIAGTISGGCANAYSSLMSIYWGEEDRDGILDLFRSASKIGLICTVGFALIMSLFSAQLTGLFFTSGTPVAEMGRRMLLLGFWFLPFSYLFNLLMNSYKAQGRMLLVNVLSFLETAMIGLLALLTVPDFGADAAWLANTWSDLISLFIVLVSAIILWQRIRLSLPEILKLPESFGAREDEYVEFAIRKMKDVIAASETVTTFCRERGLDRKKAFWAGLCVEEIASNILQHGAPGKKHYHVDVRAVFREDELTLRIQDDCIRFDPRERMEMHHPESPEKNIGLRIVAGMAKDIDYYNNAGINSLIIKV